MRKTALPKKGIAHWQDSITRIYREEKGCFLCLTAEPEWQIKQSSKNCEKILNTSSQALQECFPSLISLFQIGDRQRLLKALNAYKEGSVDESMILLLKIRNNGKAKPMIVLLSPDLEKRTHLDLLLFDFAIVGETLQQWTNSERLASVGDLSGAMAHEINNPLTAAIGLATLLAQEELSKSAKELTSDIIDNLQRAGRIAKMMLKHTLFHKGDKENVSLTDTLERTLELRREELQKKKIMLKTKIPDECIPVFADSYDLQQAFLNILLNAEDALEGMSGTITVALKAEGGFAEITISDTGKGIPEEHLPHLFQPFFTTKPEGEGTGLGLSIAAQIVEQQNGRIVVESKVGKGTTFTIELPVLNIDLDREKKGTLKERSINGTLHLLMADDDRTSAESMKSLLESKGYKVTLVHGGAEAIMALKDHRFDRVLTDWHMPGGGGKSILDFVEREQSHLLTRFIVMTGSLNDEQIKPIQQKVPVLRRPFAIDTLMEALGG